MQDRDDAQARAPARRCRRDARRARARRPRSSAACARSAGCRRRSRRRRCRSRARAAIAMTAIGTRWPMRGNSQPRDRTSNAPSPAATPTWKPDIAIRCGMPLMRATSQSSSSRPRVSPIANARTSAASCGDRRCAARFRPRVARARRRCRASASPSGGSLHRHARSRSRRCRVRARTLRRRSHRD